MVVGLAGTLSRAVALGDDAAARVVHEASVGCCQRCSRRARFL
ncbi:uncharacterized protein SOCE26_073690 [Sorangium cellulosum]|uniref:Uncharacterized protein n=1 Tax=Sorangium cellulosum TaxID=56 RepID=A0A2L0F2W2_SORCE|nr:uncharacterized protein SOCE26_073690 [Sorangium cellulosum]